jgi:hypothetical protein
MSNLNTILNKLGKIEEIEQTNLAKHEVELAIPDKLLATLKNVKQLESKFKELNSIFVKYKTEAPSLLKSIQSDLNTIEQEEARILKLVTELGLSANDMPYLKEAAQSFTLLSKLEDILKNNLK